MTPVLESLHDTVPWEFERSHMGVHPLMRALSSAFFYVQVEDDHSQIFPQVGSNCLPQKH